MADTQISRDPDADPGWAIFYGLLTGLLQIVIAFIWGISEGLQLTSFKLSVVRWGVATVAVAFASPLSSAVMGQRDDYFWTDYWNELPTVVVTIFIGGIGGHLIGRVFDRAYDALPAIRN